MGYFNKSIILGNLTRDPEITTIPGSGTKVAKFGIAATKKYKHNDEQKEETLFIDIVTFGSKADFVEKYLKKGMPALVEGELKFKQWEQDGQKRSKHEITADNIQLVERKRD